MVKKFITKILKRRHFWRYASTSELTELYISRLMRVVAVYVGASFMTVFMLQNSLSVVHVSLFWAAYFAYKAAASPIFMVLISRIGAKKSIVLSNFLYIPSMVIFMLLPEFGPIILIPVALLQGASSFLYDVGYLISFSRIKSVEVGGKEVAIMNIVEKVARAVSPLVGGVVAFLVGPKASIVASMVFFVMAAWPMMRGVETMRVRFRLKPKKFPWRKTMRGLFLHMPLGFEYYASSEAWVMFLAVVVFTIGINQVYAEIGAITSIIFIVSMAAAYVFGRFIDKKHGKSLIIWSSIVTALTYILRVFVKTPVAAISSNATREVAATGYNMAITRGMFDVADRSGYRVMYMGLTQMMASWGTAVAAAVLAIFLAVLDSGGGFAVFYLVAAVATLFIAKSRFKIYGQ